MSRGFESWQEKPAGGYAAAKALPAQEEAPKRWLFGALRDLYRGLGI